MPTMLEAIISPSPAQYDRGKNTRSVSTKITQERYDTLMMATKEFRVKKSELLAAIFDHGFRTLEKKLARSSSYQPQTQERQQPQ